MTMLASTSAFMSPRVSGLGRVLETPSTDSDTDAPRGPRNPRTPRNPRPKEA
jgi:hypothetical protein